MERVVQPCPRHPASPGPPRPPLIGRAVWNQAGGEDRPLVVPQHLVEEVQVGVEGRCGVGFTVRPSPLSRPRDALNLAGRSQRPFKGAQRSRSPPSSCPLPGGPGRAPRGTRSLRSPPPIRGHGSSALADGPRRTAEPAWPSVCGGPRVGLRRRSAQACIRSASCRRARRWRSRGDRLRAGLGPSPHSRS